MRILTRLWEDRRTIVMVTHDDRIAAHHKRTIRLFDGQVA